MLVVVQIPCLNEAETLPLVLSGIPKQMPGVDKIIVLIIDDGSTDKTVEVAKAHGIAHFVSHPATQGLGRSFHDGIMEALRLGADIVVNTDGDNQYPQDRIGDLVKPIMDGMADIVIADRQTQQIAHFSPTKKFLQKLGSAVVNRAAGTHVPDAVSGFRAYSRESLIRLNTISRFSYCTETIIQAGNKGLAIASVEVVTNAPTRPSRLFKSTAQHIRKTLGVMTQAYIMYKPHIIFGWLGGSLFVLSLVPFFRFVVLSLEDHNSAGHIQSLLVGSLLMIAAFLCLVLNIIANIIKTNRMLIELNLEQTKRLLFNKPQQD